jgi:hypothetical protein
LSYWYKVAEEDNNFLSSLTTRVWPGSQLRKEPFEFKHPYSYLVPLFEIALFSHAVPDDQREQLRRRFCNGVNELHTYVWTFLHALLQDAIAKQISSVEDLVQQNETALQTLKTCFAWGKVLQLQTALQEHALPFPEVPSTL